jgi:hypothetical protein
MSRASASIRVAFVLASVFVTTGCPVFPVSVVPAKEAPPPPSGRGWLCYQYEQTNSSVASMAGVKSACFRNAARCNQDRASQATLPGTGQVGICELVEGAACTYQFGGSGAYGCYASFGECAQHVGGMGMLPGIKQTECQMYD